jgi:hypothetical protein
VTGRKALPGVDASSDVEKKPENQSVEISLINAVHRNTRENFNFNFKNVTTQRRNVKIPLFDCPS